MYKIMQLADKRYQVLVVADSYVNPLSCLNSIADSLKDGAYKGRVLFDLLCANGQEDNRFASIEFDGAHFVRKTFSITTPDELPCSIVQSQNDFFARNPNMLTDSVLTPSEISQLISGR